MLSNPHATQPETAAELHAQDALHYRDVLHALIEMAADVARMVHAQAMAQSGATGPATGPATEPGGAPAVDFTIAFDRVSRTIRRCIVLARKIAEPAPIPAAQAEDRVAARKRVIRTVEDAIHRNAAADEAGSLRAEFVERLDAPEFEDDIGQRPIAEIIEEICRDLGVDGQIGLDFWKRRTPEDVARLCAHAARPRATTPRMTLPGPARAAGR